MTNIEKIDLLNINEELKKLESPENNLFSVWLEKIEDLYLNIPEQKIKDLMFLFNNIISEDPYIKAKGDFLWTLEKIKTEIA
jgi:hypothetical protein